MEAEQKNGTPAVTDEPSLENADPFNPSLFAAPPAQELIAAERLLVTCKVGNPAKDAFVRASADPALTMEAYILKLESTGEIYLLTPDAAQQVAESAKRVRLTAAIDRQGNPFLWMTHPVPTDGRDNSWHQSMRQAIELAKQQWIRVQSNRAAGAYDVMAAQVAIPEPEWPEYTLPDYLRAAFGDNFTITDPEDDVLRRLLGLA
jgi:hypothetical protein